MKVQIEGKLYLESDSLQFTLRRYTGSFDKQGNETYQTVGYYTNIRSALNAFLKQKIMSSTAQTLVELRTDVENISGYIESTFALESLLEPVRASSEHAEE